jgi:cyanophycin synthetase
MSKHIEILRTTLLLGPSMWTYRPALEAWVDIGDLEDCPSNTLPGLYERLTGWLPGLAEHRCSEGAPGGFLFRLREGTWPAHILEHLTLELQGLAGQPGGFGRARETSQRGVYKVVVRCPHETLTQACLHAARDLLMAAIEDRPFDVATQVDQLHRLADRLCLGPSTASIVAAAAARGIPALRLSDGNLVQLGQGCRQRRVWTAETDQTGAIAEGISRNKDLTKQLLQSCGLPTPGGQIVASAEEAWEVAQDIGLPVVVKPLRGNHGRGISIELSDASEVLRAFHVARQEDDDVLVERYINGDEHRLLVIGNRLAAAARGEQTWIVGDGQATVSALIERQVNSDPRRGEAEQFPLETIVLSREPAMRLLLERQGVNAETVLAAGQRILLQRNGNVCCDVTASVHPSFVRAACLAARAIGLDIAGIDLLAQDISQPLENQEAAIVEVNAGPGLLMHLQPAQGEAQPVGEAIVEHLFPVATTDERGRIPVIGVSGSRDTTLTARLIARLSKFNGLKVGLASKQGLFVERRRIMQGDCTHALTAQRLLVNPFVSAAVFEHDSRAILEGGMAYDRCLIGVVTHAEQNEALEDHDILTAEQVYKVLRTQVDVVLPQGVAILNADDPQVVAMAELCDGEVILCSVDAENAALKKHVEQGGRAVMARDGGLWLSTREEQARLCRLADNPLLEKGNPMCVLAAVAAAWFLGIPREAIHSGIETFLAELPDALLPAGTAADSSPPATAAATR